MVRAKTADDYRMLATRRRFCWIGSFPKNTKSLTNWRCSNGHEFQACYNNVDHEMNCRYCVRERNGANQRHGSEDYHALAKRRGFLWIGPAVNSALSETVWECKETHRWSARYNSIQQGSDCPNCSSARSAEAKRRRPSDYVALAEAKGFEWLGEVVTNTKAKTRWRCPAGHVWPSSFNQIHNGGGCPHCAPNRPKTASDFHELAARRGFKWIGEVLVNAGTKTLWECVYGHRWPSTYSGILAGRKCLVCVKKVRKTDADFRKLAEERGFTWLGPMVANTYEKTEWRCRVGHQWFASFNQVQSRSGCWRCSKRFPRTQADYLNLAAERGFEWIGPFPNSALTNTNWKCEKGHSWPAAYTTIKRGHGCPDCVDMVNGAAVSMNQRLLCEMVGGELNGARVGPYTIDIVKRTNGLNIGIEYDSWFYHGSNSEHDTNRDRLLLKSGWRILRVRSNRMLPTKDQIDDAIGRLIQEELLWLDIVLDDWGFGPTFGDVQKEKGKRKREA